MPEQMMVPETGWIWSKNHNIGTFFCKMGYEYISPLVRKGGDA
jgi:hypothetical protein